MAIEPRKTPMLDQLEEGPWPSFISGIKRLRDEHPDEGINKVTNSLLGQLEHSYETRKGYWKRSRSCSGNGKASWQENGILICLG